jgi:tRNA threonylcarbamoyladenosine biosynthesis protein TsaB
MLTLTLRTDKPEAELGLFDGTTELAYVSWPAHRRLAETIHLKIRDLFQGQGRQLSDLEAIIIYKGPGSFTGLRIGFSVANALADSLQVPVRSAAGEDWIRTAQARPAAGGNEHTALPEYGAPAKTTRPKK